MLWLGTTDLSWEESELPLLCKNRLLTITAQEPQMQCWKGYFYLFSFLFWAILPLLFLSAAPPPPRLLLHAAAVLHTSERLKEPCEGWAGPSPPHVRRTLFSVQCIYSMHGPFSLKRKIYRTQPLFNIYMYIKYIYCAVLRSWGCLIFSFLLLSHPFPLPASSRRRGRVCRFEHWTCK